MDELRTTPHAKALVEFDDFAKLDLRVARVLECREHPNADKLLILKVDLGEPAPRQVCAVLKNHYKPEDLVGRLVVVVANLEPRSMRGEVSQGLVLSAAEGPMKQRMVVLAPSAEVAPGSPIG
jgi:methionyl-tRNA synthetase